MAEAAARLGHAIEAAPIRPGRPQAFNVDGRIRTEPADIAAALQAQLTSPVRWTTCIETLVASGVDRFLELGPGSTLTAMGKRINPEVTWSAVSSPSALATVGR